MNAIEFRGVSKSYPVYASPRDRLKELLTIGTKSFHEDFWALRDITFTVGRGQTFCVVGENGSGKSTLLQIIAGILRPTSGEVIVNGRVAALLELGSGFNLEFTGHDNVFLNASILGLTSREIEERYDSIASFAEIGDFIHQPVKTYSSGMVVRLAFSVAIHVDPEILLVDEALAVGDIYFRQRCMRKVHELRSRGVTIVFVSHALGDVKAIGDTCMWLEHGRVRDFGSTDSVVPKYLAEMTAKDSAYLGQITAAPQKLKSGRLPPPPESLERIPNIDHRHGDGRALVTGIAAFDEFGREVRMLSPASRIILRISVRACEDVHHPNVGFMMRNHLGLDFCGSNTLREGHVLPAMRAGDRLTIDFRIDIPELYPADFSFSPAIADGTLQSYTMCDWIDNAITLQMGHGEGQVYGYLHLPCKVEVNARLPQPGGEQQIA
ncbi:MAG: ABC transporter ATP-binding protein [Bryobacteraceae bacterium]|nr:ABC transporter ATP-binding protein [Bryobacteraceae bacterium]